MIAAHLRLRIRLQIALLHAVLQSLDRSRQIVVLFIVVVVGQYTVTDPAAWIAAVRPLLLAPHTEAGGYLPSLVLALAVIGIGVAMRPVFEWSGHSRYLAHIGSARLPSLVGDAVLVALLMLPFATMLTAGVARWRVVDGAAIATLVMAIVLLAVWLRVAARSVALATAVVGGSVVAVALIGAHATGPVILSVVSIVTLATLVTARRLPRRTAGRGRWWTTRSPRADLWLQLHLEAVRIRWPWMFVPTLALAALSGWMIGRPVDDPVLLLTALLLVWQLVAAAKTTALAMDSWRRSRVLRQLPARVGDRALCALVSSVALFALASPAEAMSLHASGNAVVASWASLAAAAPWVALWSQSTVLLRGVLSWSALVAVAFVTVAQP